MLSLVVDDFTKGVDIQSRYPEYFERLLNNPRLQIVFLEILDMIEQAAREELHAVAVRSPDLSFLAVQPPKPTIENLAGNWRASWKLTTQTLKQLFSPQLGSVVRGDDLLEDPWFILIRTELEVADLQLLVNLEAAQDMDEPETLKLQLAVFNMDPAATSVPPLEAHLAWNTYRQIIRVQERGPTPFPDLSLHEITDPSSGALTGDIDLSIRPAP